MVGCERFPVVPDNATDQQPQEWLFDGFQGYNSIYSKPDHCALNLYVAWCGLGPSIETASKRVKKDDQADRSRLLKVCAAGVQRLDTAGCPEAIETPYLTMTTQWQTTITDMEHYQTYGILSGKGPDTISSEQDAAIETLKALGKAIDDYWNKYWLSQQGKDANGKKVQQ